MSKQRHDPHSGHDHIEGQQGQKSNSEIDKLRIKEEETNPKVPGEEKGEEKSEDGRPHKPQKKDHG